MMYSRTKKYTLVAIAAASALALAGCAGGNGGDDGASGGTLRLATLSGDAAALKTVTDEFTKETGIEVKIETGQDDQYNTTIQSQLAAGTAPDVFFIYPGSSQPLSTAILSKNGSLADISDRAWVADVPESYSGVIEGADGKTYVAPVAVASANAMYNESTLEKLGLTAPTTWSEVLDFCAATKAQGVAAYALGIQTNWVGEILPFPLVAELVYQPGNTFDDDLLTGKTTFAESGWNEALHKYQELGDEGCFQDGPTGTSYDASLEMVATGQAAGMVQVTSALGGIQALAPEGTKFSVQTFPASDDTSKTMTVGAAASGYGVFSKSKNLDNALLFMDFLMKPASLNSYATAVAGVPSIPNDQFTEDDSNRVLIEAQRAGTTVNYPDQLWPTTKVTEAINGGIQEMFNGSSTPDKVLEAMQTALDNR